MSRPGHQALCENVQRQQRRRQIRARHLAIYLSHTGFGLSQKATGKLFGRDRTTVRYVCARVENMRDDPRIDRMLDALLAATLAFTVSFFSNISEVQS